MTKQERSWILQDFGNSVYSIAITTALLPVFFKEYAGSNLSGVASTAFWGDAQSIGTLIISILAPILGSLADYRGYKKKLFTIFLGLALISTAALATVNQGQWILCLIIYILSMIGSTGSNIFYDSFLTDVTDDERMDMISSQGFGFGYLGGTVGFAICMALIMLAPKLGLKTIDATKISFIITAIWWLLFSIPLLKNVNQIHYIEGQPEGPAQIFKKLLGTFKEIINHKNLALFFLAYFFYIDGVHTIITMATPIGMDLGLDSKKLLLILLFIQLVAFPFAILYGYLAKRIGTRKMILVGILTYVGISIFGYFLSSIRDFWILAFLVASAQGGIQALSRSYFGKLIPKNKSCEYFGVFNIFGKISSIFGPFLMARVTLMTGQSRYGILSLIILFILGLYFFLKVTDEKVNLRRDEI